MSLQLTAGRYFGDTISNRDLSFFTCSITRYRGFEDIKKHYHDNAYLSLLMNGLYTERTGNTDVQLQAGQLIFRPVGYPHANHFHDSGGACFNIEFRNGFHEYIPFSLQLPHKAHIYSTGAFPSLYKLLHYYRDALDEVLLQELLLLWLLEVSQAPLPQSSTPWLLKVKRILDHEPDAHHSIHSLAARVFVHPVYLARAFKAKTGLTPGEYQLQGRLQKALHLLLNTSLPVTEIAYTTGFFDPAHLVRSFKRRFGKSPGQFRQALKS